MSERAISYELLQPWYCSRCAQTGSVPCKPGEDNFTIRERAVAAHAKVRPFCARTFAGAGVKLPARAPLCE